VPLNNVFRSTYKYIKYYIFSDKENKPGDCSAACIGETDKVPNVTLKSNLRPTTKPFQPSATKDHQDTKEQIDVQHSVVLIFYFMFIRSLSFFFVKK